MARQITPFIIRMAVALLLGHSCGKTVHAVHGRPQPFHTHVSEVYLQTLQRSICATATLMASSVNLRPAAVG